MKALPIFALLIGLFAAPAVAADCPSIRIAAEAATRQGDIDKLKLLFRQADGCDSELRAWLGQQTAAQLYNRATQGSKVDISLLREALNYGRTWQILATLADVASEQKDHQQAAQRYLDALVEIADKERTPMAPSSEIILAIRKKAEQSTLLAPRYVESMRGRDGTQVGVGAASVRGIKIESVALPITFKFDSADLTAAGELALADLVGLLSGEAPRRIVIVGHTDQSGEDAYNMALSIRRAEAIRAALLRRGLAHRIDIVGKGEREPYVPDDPGAFSPAERDQLSRRVEIIRP